MANEFFYVTATGSATTLNGHASREDGNWGVDAQCYSSVILAVLAASQSAGNTVLLDNGTFNQAGQLGSIGGGHWNNSPVLDSRNSDPALSTLLFTTLTANGFYFQPTSASTVEIKNISYGYSGTFVGSGAGNTAGLMYGVGTFLGNVTFRNCKIVPFDISLSATAGAANGLLLGNASIPTTAGVQTPSNPGLGRWWRFFDCDFSGITELVSSNAAFFRLGASARVSFYGGSIKNCQKAVLLATDTNYGMFLVERAASGQPMIEFLRSETTGLRPEFHDNVQTCTTGNITSCRPFIYGSQTLCHFNIAALDIRRCHLDSTITNGTHGIFAFMTGNYHVGDVYAEECSKVAYVGGGPGGDGGLFYASGLPDAVTFELDYQMVDIEAHRITSRSGAVAFASNGAVADFKRIKAYDCVNVVGVLYSGGHADAYMESCLVVRASSPLGGATDGVAVLSRFNRTATWLAGEVPKDKFTSLKNITIVDCENDGGDVSGVYISAEGNVIPDYDHNFEIDNVISQNTLTGAVENDIAIEWYGATAVPMTGTARNNNARNGIYTNPAQLGTSVFLTETGTTTTMPSFVDAANDDYRISSPQGTGSATVLPLNDVDNVAFRNPPNFGAYSFYASGGSTPLPTPRGAYKASGTMRRMSHISSGYATYTYSGIDAGVSSSDATASGFFANDKVNTFAVNDIVMAQLSDGFFILQFTDSTTASIVALGT